MSSNYGSRYEMARGKTTAEIAKLIRADIKREITKPFGGARITVKAIRGKVNVTIHGLSDSQVYQLSERPAGPAFVLRSECAELRDAIEKICDRYKATYPQSSAVNFFGFVDFATEGSERHEAEQRLIELGSFGFPRYSGTLHRALIVANDQGVKEHPESNRVLIANDESNRSLTAEIRPMLAPRNGSPDVLTTTLAGIALLNIWDAWL